MIELARRMSASPHLYQYVTHLNEKGVGVEPCPLRPHNPLESTPSPGCLYFVMLCASACRGRPAPASRLALPARPEMLLEKPPVVVRQPYMPRVKMHKEDDGRHRKMWIAFGVTLALISVVFVLQMRSALGRFRAAGGAEFIARDLGATRDELDALLDAQSPALQSSYQEAAQETGIYLMQQEALQNLSDELKTEPTRTTPDQSSPSSDGTGQTETE